MIIILPTKRISALSWWKTFMRVLATRWRRKQLTLKLRHCRSMYNKISTRRLPLVRYIICKGLIITRRTAYSRSLLATRLSTESNRAWSTGTYVCTYGWAGGVRTTWRVLGELSARRSTARWSGRPSNAASVTSCYCVVASCCSNCGRGGNNITSIAGSFSLPRTNWHLVRVNCIPSIASRT